VYRAFLPERILGRAPRQDSAGREDDESDPRAGEQSGVDGKAEQVVEALKEMKLKEAAKKLLDSIEETLTYTYFPFEHWLKIRTNNAIEQVNREIRRRTRVVGCFPDGNSALMLVCARLRYAANSRWGNKKYMSMKRLRVVSAA
jgi:transposase-like protein